MKAFVWIGILLAVAVLLWFLLTRHCRIHVMGGSGEKWQVELRYGFFRLFCYPKRETLPDRLSGRKLRRLLEKEKKKTAKKTKAAGKKKKKSAPGSAGNGQGISVILALLRDFLADGLYPHLETKLHRLYLSVATGNAATTAYCYTGVITALNGIFALLDGGKSFRIDSADRVCLLPDFAGKDCRWAVDAEFRLRVHRLLLACGKALFRYWKQNNPKLQKNQTLSTVKGA